MELTHSFTVPTSVDETWAHFNDIASVAQCFPGATLSETDGETFSGSVKVKLGPIALVYNGTGTFIEKDEPSHTLKIEAKGKDKRGNGTAGANVTLTMGVEGDDATKVDVATDLSITGKPAQFGRGVIQDVSDKLLGQFVACLEDNLSGTGEDDAPEEAAAPTPAAPQAGAEAAPDPAPAAAPAPAPTQQPRPDEAIDLGVTVLPVIAKAYWKQGAGALVALLVILWWVFGKD